MDFINQLLKGLREIKPSSMAFIIVLILLSLLFYFIALRFDKKTFTTKVLVYASICIAMSFVLSYIKLYQWPQGGSVTLGSMLPLMVFAYLFGPRNGIMAGLVYSILQLIQDAYVIHWAQLLFDYPFAFAAIGLAGYSRNSLSLGVLIGGFGRFFFHFISGAIFFGSYAPEGQAPFIYSLIVNGLIIGTDTLICFAITLIIPFKVAVKKLKPKLVS